MTIKIFGFFLFTLHLLFYSNNLLANESLAQKNGCLTCHGINNKIGTLPIHGPALIDISAKYKGIKSAKEMLVERVKNGTSGVWGESKMPAMSPQVKDEEIKIIIQWVLSL